MYEILYGIRWNEKGKTIEKITLACFAMGKVTSEMILLFIFTKIKFTRDKKREMHCFYFILFYFILF